MWWLPRRLITCAAAGRPHRAPCNPPRTRCGVWPKHGCDDWPADAATSASIAARHSTPSVRPPAPDGASSEPGAVAPPGSAPTQAATPTPAAAPGVPGEDGSTQPGTDTANVAPGHPLDEQQQEARIRRYQPAGFLWYFPPQGRIYNLLSFRGQSDPHGGKFFVPNDKRTSFMVGGPLRRRCGLAGAWEGRQGRLASPCEGDGRGGGGCGDCRLAPGTVPGQPFSQGSLPWPADQLFEDDTQPAATDVPGRGVQQPAVQASGSAPLLQAAASPPRPAPGARHPTTPPPPPAMPAYGSAGGPSYHEHSEPSKSLCRFCRYFQELDFAWEVDEKLVLALVPRAVLIVACAVKEHYQLPQLPRVLLSMRTPNKVPLPLPLHPLGAEFACRRRCRCRPSLPSWHGVMAHASRHHCRCTSTCQMS